MSTITLSPCGHSLSPEQTMKTLGEKTRVIRIDEIAQPAFAQINEQLQKFPLNCPLCSRRVEKIDPNKVENLRFPMSISIVEQLQISPLNVNLHSVGNREAKSLQRIHFKRIELNNIINKGQHSNDNGTTYQHCVDLANDFNGLVSSFGNVYGRMLYWLPTSWKASAFISGMHTANEKQLTSLSWVLSNDEGRCIGLFSLSQIPNEKFELDDDLRKLKLYNVGAFLHSNYQRRGVITEITNRIYDRFFQLNLDIDGLWIMTRVENEGVNHIAKKLNFTFIKTMNVKHEGLIPCFSDAFIPMNLYIKRL